MDTALKSVVEVALSTATSEHLCLDNHRLTVELFRWQVRLITVFCGEKLGCVDAVLVQQTHRKVFVNRQEPLLHAHIGTRAQHALCHSRTRSEKVQSANHGIDSALTGNGPSLVRVPWVRVRRWRCGTVTWMCWLYLAAAHSLTRASWLDWLADQVPTAKKEKIIQSTWFFGGTRHAWRTEKNGDAASTARALKMEDEFRQS